MERAICSICHEHLFKTGFITSTICGHVFHEECIKEWMKRSRSCPECRKTLPVKSSRRLYFNSEPIPEGVEKKALKKKITDLQKELEAQKKTLKPIADLRKELEAQKTRYEEVLWQEEQIQRELRNENKKLMDKIQKMEGSRTLVRTISHKNGVVEILDD